MLDDDARVIERILGDEDESLSAPISVAVSSDLLAGTKNEARRLFYVSLLAQGGALLVAKTAVAPLDRLQLLRQVHSPSVRLFSDLRWFQGFRQHAQHAVLGNFARLWLLSKLRRGESEITPHVVSAFVAASLVYPLDVRYVQTASGCGKVGNFWNFRGFGYHAISAPVYLVTSLGTLHVLGRFCDDKQFPANVMAGSVAALAGSVTAYPLETLRRRQIVGNVSRTSLFSGLSIHVVKAIPECFVLGAVYSELLKLNYF